jgi:hypothetical protein
VEHDTHAGGASHIIRTKRGEREDERERKDERERDGERRD